MLPSYADCPRRAAAKQYTGLLRDAGFELRSLLPSIGAAVGTATHAAAAHLLGGKLLRGVLAPVDESVDVAIAKLREEIAPGAEWDDTTPNLQVAEFQVRRLALAYAPHAAAITPAAVELDLRATSGEWNFTGHVDLLTTDGHLDDLKTGAVRRPYQTQLGGYALLAEANTLTVRSTGITFIPRAPKTRPQPPPEQQAYELDNAKRAAWATINAIKRDVAAFKANGDPHAFVANPMSMNCTKTYCAAWGTRFCKMHLPSP
jgi:hypothetical protein